MANRISLKSQALISLSRKRQYHSAFAEYHYFYLTDKSKFELKIPACAAGITSAYFNLSEGLFDLSKASFTYSLTAEKYNVIGIITEYARGLIFLEDDLIILSEYLKGILLVYVHGLSDTDGKNDSSKLVYLSDYAR